MQAQGREHLTPHASLICPNHVSFMDGFLIFLVTRPTAAGISFSWAPPFTSTCPLSAHLVKALRVIPVDSARHLVDAMQASAYVLRHGKTLCVFPEGSRSITGELLPIRKGVVILAKELDVPIMPAYIQGAHEAWGPTRAFPRPHPVKVIFGPDAPMPNWWRPAAGLNPTPRDDDAAALGLRQAIEDLRVK